ncbi:MAG TPA: hypothetical protein IAC04_07390 [Candidatus Coprenecus stercoravium]|uniref:Uncharacterized protein n=1 Tax=Candidatus Coprenecus stercoravium TaxID=2840735 RepID=A0A9D2K9A1_9BACT|nr:hypothetical protein [Candidatus Coprenecus stercoravium]
MENNFDKNGLSVEKSLEIISEAINNSQRDFQRRGGTAMLIWGTTILLVSGIVTLGLSLSDNNYLWHLAWFLIPFIGLPLDRIASKRYKRSGQGENFVSKAVGLVWGIFGIMAVATGITAFFIPIATNGTIILLLGMAGAVTGALNQSWTVFILGIISGIAGLPCDYFLNIPTPLIMAFAALMTLVIPGLIFNRQNRKLL